MVRPDRDRLSGTVEVDEVMIGGIDAGTAGAGEDKVPVMVAVERCEASGLAACAPRSPPRRAPCSWSPSPPGSSSPDSTNHTDGARGLRRLADTGHIHQYTTGYNAAADRPSCPAST